MKFPDGRMAEARARVTFVTPPRCSTSGKEFALKVWELPYSKMEGLLATTPSV